MQDAPGSWDFLLRQRGMFSFTGLSRDVVQRLRCESHIYILDNGRCVVNRTHHLMITEQRECCRVSVSGVNASNVQRVAQSVAAALRC
jgi:aspartate/tyrosine/aromatic aminotransferase